MEMIFVLSNNLIERIVNKMKLSRKFVSDYIALDDTLSILDIALAMTDVGNEFDDASPLIKCSNLVVGEVKTCENHPDSDHLHVCNVDVGEKELTIVCGAPNVAAGQKVIVALPGAVLPLGEIKKSNIRGVESNGMICSIAELGLDNKFLEEKDKAGIHVFPDTVEVGSDPIKALGLDDEVIDFELTSNRGDLLSVLGMAYELGAIYKKKVGEVEVSYKENKEDIKNSFEVEVETENCPLFLAKKVKNLTIKESPDFIKNRLIASGIRPINNVVDISNYVMLELGQPLHYYDAKRLGGKILVRMAKENETLTTLDNIERTLSKEDIVITDGKKAVGLAGVMGGLSTEVESDTKEIIIESAIFDPVKIRKTSKKILRSEASNRFEKGLDPKRSYLAIERSCHLLEKYADAEIVSGMVIYDKTKKEDKVISITVDKIKKVLGIEIEKDKVISIFQDLGFVVVDKKDHLEVSVPSRRLDIHIEEDLIEEVGRIYGMDKIEGSLPALNMVIGSYDKTKRSIKHYLADLGLNETFSYTLIPKSEATKFTTDKIEPIYLDYPMSEDKNTLRYSLLYSLKDIYDYNKNRGMEDLSIFEVGKGFYQENGIYKEEEKLAVLMTGDFYLGVKKEKVDFYIIKGILESFLDYLGYQNRYRIEVPKEVPKEFHKGQSADIILQGKKIGIIGKLHPNVVSNDVFVFEINLSLLLQNKGTRMEYKDIPKYPSIIKDVAFVLAKEIPASNVLSIIKKQGGKLLTDIDIFDVYEGEHVKENEKSLAFRLTFQDPKRTLTEEEVMDIFHKIIEKVKQELKAEIRDN